MDINSLPVAVDSHLLSYLSCLRIDYANNVSFHRIIGLLSSVFGQLRHLSLKLEVCTLNSDPLCISDDIIQQLCIDCLKPSATCSLNLLLYVELSIKIIDNQQIMFQGIKPVMLTHFGLTNPKLLPTLNTFYLKYFDGVSHEGDEDEDNDSDKE
ncbi:unnamed protein product [Rotaria sp. Silwood2]|nr:unnamed protein product [Rotaria sp. Silwood2]CAF4062658.1 unnamed protein product [Rotaria sp. Silwood2]